MSTQIKAKLDRSFMLTHDLALHLEELSLNLDLPNLKISQIN